MRIPFLALPALALLAWTLPSAPPAPPAEAPSPVGAWAFTMERSGGDPLSGTMFIAADGSGRIEVTRPRVDAPVRGGQLDVDGDGTFTWTGRAGSPLGPLPFTLRGTVSGDRLTGQSEVAGMGRARVQATRQP